MNTEQLRADFEVWALNERIAYRDEKYGLCFYNGERNSYWIGYQAGRAALQSQDREDVTALKVGLEEAAQTMRAVLAQERLKAVAKRCLSRAIGVCDRAIDHARRIEEEGK